MADTSAWAVNLFDHVVKSVGNTHKRLVFIGDAVWDHWIHGRVEDCQEGCPKFTMSAESDHVVPGGVANAVQCLVDWVVDVDMFTYPAEMWPDKFRMVDPGGRIVFRVDEEGGLAMQEWLHSGHRRDSSMALRAAHRADAVLLSDYDKGYLTPELIRRIVDQCREDGIPCVVDAKREPSIYRGAILKCNEHYNAQYAEVLEFTKLVVTRGAAIPVVWDRYLYGLLSSELSPVECVNHVGAGDCFAAHLTLALACGLTLEGAAAIAHSAGRVYVQRPHNRAPTRGEVRADLAGAIRPQEGPLPAPRRRPAQEPGGPPQDAAAGLPEATTGRP